MTPRWRQGEKVPHHVYRQRGDEPDCRPWPDGDRPVATFFDPNDAELACHAVAFAVSQQRGFVPVGWLMELADDWELMGYEPDDPQHAAYRECAARLRMFIHSKQQGGTP